jgi:hypothetical protein
MSALAVAVLDTACAVPPVPGHVIVTGDSIALQGWYLGGNYRDATVYTGLGWRASHSYPMVAADVTDAGRSPQVLVMAYGHNYTTTGMTSADRTELADHARLIHPDACLVILLPAYPGPDEYRRQVIDAYRAWAYDFEAGDPSGVVLVDWAAVVADHLDYLGDDYVHLSETGAPAFTDLVNGGVDTCLSR